jgi:CRP-like cAMP-binding protein
MNKRDSARTQRAQSGPGNSLLHALPPAEYRRLLAVLEQVTLTFGEVLHEPGAPLRYAYFPIDSVIALQTMAKGHHPLKIALVGHEGIVGIPLALGIQTSFRRALVQGTGTAMRMESALLQKEVLASGPLQHALFRFKHALVAQIERSAACKQFHSIQARLVRYLLMTSERARSNEIHLTQEFVAEMLGVRRISVGKECSALQKRALIRYSRGKITILDRKHLGAASCECYQIINRIYDGAYEGV